MEHAHAIKALTDKRAELAAVLEHHQAAVRQALADIEHVDAALRIFGVGRDDDKVLRQNYRGEIARIVLDAIRESKHGLTSEELAQRVLIERRMNPDDRKRFQTVAKRVRGCLQHYRRKGALVSRENDDGVLEWTVA